MVALLFPGQGSQALGMGQALAQAVPPAAAVFEALDDALGEKLSAVIWGEDPDALTATANAQPAILATSIAALRALESRAGPMAEWTVRPSWLAGHSLGEYSAHVAAGSFDFATAARLLRIRGNAMQAAVPSGQGAMAAILNLDMAPLVAICAQAESDGGPGACCAVANDNAPGQIVISGDTASVERAMQAASAAGAKRSVLLPVSAPFHCALMQPAQQAMARALAEVAVADPNYPLISNADAARVDNASQVRDTLTRQVTGRVRWVESVGHMAESGVSMALELGHGKVLAGLNRRIAKHITTCAVGTVAEIEAAVALVNGG